VCRLRDARAIRHAEEEHRGVVDPSPGGFEEVRDEPSGVAGHRLVDRPGGPDEGRVGVDRRHQKVRVEGDAVAPDARPGVVNLTVRLGVRHVDRLPPVDFEPLAHPPQFVRQRDVDVSVDAFEHLHGLRRRGVAHRNDLVVGDRLVEALCGPGRPWVRPADDLRVRPPDVAEGAPARGALRTERDTERLGSEPGLGGEQRLDHVATRPRRDGTLEEDGVAGVESRRDLPGHRSDDVEVRPRALVEFRRDHDDVDARVRGRSLAVRRRTKRAIVDRLVDEVGQAGFVRDVALARVDRLDDRLVDVDADDVPGALGQRGGERESHLAEAVDGDLDPAVRDVVRQLSVGSAVETVRVRHG